MIVKSCPQCNGQPYTTDLKLAVCPNCGHPLMMESVAEEELFGRPLIAEDPNNEPLMPSSGNAPSTAGRRTPGQMTPFGENTPAQINNNRRNNDMVHTGGGNHQTAIRGRVLQYSNSAAPGSEHHRRFLIQKIRDAIVYHQRFDDVVHRFQVRTEQGLDEFGQENTKDVPVNVHGTVASGSMIISDNCIVEVNGKYMGNVLMAREVYVISNGSRSLVRFQRSVGAIVYGILAVIAAIVLIAFAASSKGDFLSNLKNFFVTWGIVFAALSIIDIVLRLTKLGLLAQVFSGRRRRFPFALLLILSTLITIGFLSFFGIGASIGNILSGLLTSLLPVVIVIVIIVLIIKAIFK